MHTFKRSSTHTTTHTHTSRSKVNTAASLTLNVRRMRTVSHIHTSALSHTHTNTYSARLKTKREGKRAEQIHRTCTSFTNFAFFVYQNLEKKQNKKSLCYPNSTFEKLNKKEREENSRP